MEALRAQLRAGGMSALPDDDVLQMMLDLENGDVAAAARAVRDAHAAERASAETMRETSTAPIDPHDDAADRGHELRQNETHHTLQHVAGSGNTRWISTLWRIVWLPFSFLTSAVLFCLRLVGFAYPLPRNGHAQPLTRLSQDPVACARRWIEQLELDTGGSVYLHTNFEAASLTRLPLPPFFVGSYTDALRCVKRDMVILAVILTSGAHSDDKLFRTRVLTDPELVRTLRSPEFVVWGGDVRNREAFQGRSLYAY